MTQTTNTTAPPLKVMTPEELWRFGELLHRHPWRFAKTMPHIPHWYTLRKEWHDVGMDVFDEMLVTVRQGAEEQYANKDYPFRYVVVNGRKYWENPDWELDRVQLLNRREVRGEKDIPHPYDAIASMYDLLTCARDMQPLLELANIQPHENVLDIGCGTGVVLDHVEINPLNYTGMDPSGGMLAQLAQKHPYHRDSVMQCKLEEFTPDETGPYDVVLCLGGAAAQIDAAFLEAIPKMVGPGGRWVVEFLQEGRVVYGGDLLPSALPVVEGVHADLPGERHERDGMVVVTGRRE